MAFYPGKDFLLFVRDEAGTAWVEIAGMRETGETSSHQPADGTTKNSGSTREYAGGTGFIETRISASGVITAIGGYKRLQAIQKTRQPEDFQLRYGDGDIGDCSAFVATLERTGPYEDLQQFSMELMVSGEVAVSAAP